MPADVNDAGVRDADRERDRECGASFCVPHPAVRAHAYFDDGAHGVCIADFVLVLPLQY